MKKLSVKQLTIIRNAIIAFIMIGGFIAWFFLPTFVKNTALVHVGTGAMGHKIGALLAVLLPLFALIPNTKREEIHTDDPEERKALEEQNGREDRKMQIAVALLELLVLAVIYGLWMFFAVK